ncbi:MAG: hypothetical protein QOJ86_3702 [Bradyrhizobium sp.]|jgi:hypothetical protein|nr:hypothetical protein [Bradyrhizobium sp.]
MTDSDDCRTPNKPRRDHVDYITLIALLAAFAAACYAGYWTKQLAIDAQQTAKRQFRAYVLYEGGTVNVYPSRANYTVTVSVRNSGQTPAYHLLYSWDSKVLDFPLRDDPEFPNLGNEESADVASSSTVTLGDRRTFSISDEDLVAVRDRRKAIFVWANLKYVDTFQEQQTAKFFAVNSSETNQNQMHLRNYFHSMSDNR